MLTLERHVDFWKGSDSYILKVEPSIDGLLPKSVLVK